ncbi:MAG: hypothetical protein ACI8RD_010424 [Bacillariaceae sp.]|jgi:hypothetical protein
MMYAPLTEAFDEAKNITQQYYIGTSMYVV